MVIFKWLNENFEKVFTTILFMAFSGLMIINVLMILISNEAISWASEGVMLLFVFFVWVAISYAFKERKHISVTALTDMFPEKGRKMMSIIVNFIVIAFFAVLAYAGIELLLHPSVLNKSSLLIQYPMWLFYFSAPLGASLSIIRLLQNTIEDLKNFNKETTV
ncbi:TRAP transporter small permease [Bacillus sp. REN16]|uniref:TRAP transporter small permease n=1 Tax=Bacillus sp. REN16 TaxID=2887296 RepID=UPI001E50A5DF|nr:TRAP transporter small permease [Bacillus sp. REN16]MCC3358981.1 TRAP transporter small permease [Bacillus sp. REN16]